MSLLVGSKQIMDAFKLLQCAGVSGKWMGGAPMTGDTVVVKLDMPTGGLMKAHVQIPMHAVDIAANIIDGAIEHGETPTADTLWLADYLVANRETEVHVCMESTRNPNPPMVRVAIKHPRDGEPGSVHVLSLDRELHDLRLRDVYWDPADLPEWLHDRLVKLMVMPLPPPPLSIEDIGQRISNDVFWIYIPKEL